MSKKNQIVQLDPKSSKSVIAKEEQNPCQIWFDKLSSDWAKEKKQFSKLQLQQMETKVEQFQLWGLEDEGIIHNPELNFKFYHLVKKLSTVINQRRRQQANLFHFRLVILVVTLSNFIRSLGQTVAQTATQNKLLNIIQAVAQNTPSILTEATTTAETSVVTFWITPIVFIILWMIIEGVIWLSSKTLRRKTKHSKEN